MKKAFILILIIALSTISCRKEFNAELCLDGEISPPSLGFYDYSWCGKHVDRIEWYLDGELINPENNGKGGVTVHINENRDYELKLILFKEKEGSLFGKELQDEKTIEIKPKPSVIIDIVECEDTVVKSGDLYNVILFEDAYELQDYLRNGNVEGVEFNTYENYSYLNQSSSVYTILNLVSLGEHLLYIEPSSSYTMGNLPYIMNNMMENNSSKNIEIVNEKFQTHTKSVMELDQHLLDLITHQFYRINQYDTSPYTCWDGSLLTFNIDGTWEFTPGNDPCGEGLTYTSGTYKFNNFSCTIYEGTSTPSLTLENPSGNGIYPNGGVLYIQGDFDHDLAITYQDSFGQYQTHRFRETSF